MQSIKVEDVDQRREKCKLEPKVDNLTTNYLS